MCVIIKNYFNTFPVSHKSIVLHVRPYYIESLLSSCFIYLWKKRKYTVTKYMRLSKGVLFDGDFNRISE